MHNLRTQNCTFSLDQTVLSSNSTFLAPTNVSYAIFEIVEISKYIWSNNLGSKETSHVNQVSSFEIMSISLGQVQNNIQAFVPIKSSNNKSAPQSLG